MTCLHNTNNCSWRWIVALVVENSHVFSFFKLPNLQLKGKFLLRQFYLRRWFSQFLSLSDNFLDGTNHVEGGFGQMIVFTMQDALESLFEPKRKNSHVSVRRIDSVGIVPWWSRRWEPIFRRVQRKFRQLGKVAKGNVGSYGHGRRWVCLLQTTHPYPKWQ